MKDRAGKGSEVYFIEKQFRENQKRSKIKPYL